MSVFVKAERFGGRAKLFRIRGACAAVGEDCDGILTCRAPQQLFFTLCQRNDGVLLKAGPCGVTVGGQPLRAGADRRIAAGDSVSLNDYRFTFFPSGTALELLAATRAGLEELCSLSLDSSGLGRWELLYDLAGFSRRWPLPSGFELAIGSADEAALYIDLPRVAPLHCRLSLDGGGVRVVRLAGEIAVNGEPAANRMLQEGDRIRLLPAAAELRLLRCPPMLERRSNSRRSAKEAAGA